MWHERHRPAVQLLLDFRVCAGGPAVRMRRRCHGIRRMCPLTRSLARARDPGLGIDDDLTREQPRIGERRECQQRRGGIAPRARDEPCVLNGRPIALRQPVDRNHAGRLRLGVQRSLRGLVTQAKRARQIDNAHASIDERRRDVCRGILG